MDQLLYVGPIRCQRVVVIESVDVYLALGTNIDDFVVKIVDFLYSTVLLRHKTAICQASFDSK